jgi:hypothetical protein
MRVKTSRGRGRPPGKHRSSADSGLLQYLALISIKYGIESEKFFDGLVEAWKRRQATCESLSIECRRKTRDNAVFLITNDFRVVAQFSIPKRILEETSPLKGFALTRALKRKITKRIEVEHPRIGDLKSGMKRIDLRARILEIPRPRNVITKFGDFATVTNASIADETGSIQLPLWNRQIDTFSVGDTIRVENARVVTFRGERQLRIGRGGQLSVIEER